MTSAARRNWRQKSGTRTAREIVWRGWRGSWRLWAQEVDGIWAAWRSNTTRSNWSCRREKPSTVGNTDQFISADTGGSHLFMRSRDVSAGNEDVFSSFLGYSIDLYREDISVPHVCCQSLWIVCFQSNNRINCPLIVNLYCISIIWQQLNYYYVELYINMLYYKYICNICIIC